MVTFRLSPLVHHMSYSLPSMFIFVLAFYAFYAVIVLFFCFLFHFTILAFISSPHVLAWVPFFRTHSYTQVSRLYSTPTSVPLCLSHQFLNSHNYNIHAVAHLAASLPSKNKKLQNKSPKALGSKYPLEKRLWIWRVHITGINWTCFQRGFIAQLVERHTGIVEVMGTCQ